MTFDTGDFFTIPVRTSKGPTDCKVRWPTDEEWAQHRKRRKLFQRQLGRGASETEIDSGEADAKLYEIIRVDGAPPLTVGEASHIIDIVARCRVLKVQLGATDAVVEMQILTGKAQHTVKIPTMDQVRTFQRSAHLINLPHNLQEIRASLDAAARLWDECDGKAEGYAAGVPNIHKDEAIRAVISEVDREMTPTYDEENF